MATVGELQDVVGYIKGLSNGNEIAKNKALVAMMQQSELYAKQNIKENFIGRNGRRLSGGLLNNVFIEYDLNKMEGYLGVKTVPYARIHEYGGTIKPVNAKNLWIPRYENAGKMTPREFFNLKNREPRRYVITNTGAYKVRDLRRKVKDMIQLFRFSKRVEIPERPYLTPALDKAGTEYAEYYEQFLKNELPK
jgi:phage gpG-like protein